VTGRDDMFWEYLDGSATTTSSISSVVGGSSNFSILFCGPGGEIGSFANTTSSISSLGGGSSTPS